MSNVTNGNEITNTINNEPLINTKNSNEITDSDNHNNNIFLLYFDNKGSLCILIIILIIAIALVIPIFIFIPIIAIATLLIIYFFIIITFLGCLRRYVRLRKNVDKNELEISDINYLKCTKNTLQLKLDSTNFIVKFLERDDGDSEIHYTTYYTTVFIMNNFKNYDEIDIDKSNIIYKPFIFYYKIEGINMEIYEDFDVLENQLNSFINSPADINKLNQIIDNKFKKLSDHFYSYVIQSRSNNQFCLFIFFFTIAYWVFVVVLVQTTIKEKSLLIWIGFIGGYFFCLLILFLIINHNNNNKIIRIDFIFSKNFDKIFIGNVRLDGESYRDTYILEMNRINRFFLDQKNINTSLLRVIESNNYIDILEIKDKNFTQLENLVNLLNRKLNENNNNNNNINNINNIQQTNGAILPNN